jgi:hypothetical protein
MATNSEKNQLGAPFIGGLLLGLLIGTYFGFTTRPNWVPAPIEKPAPEVRRDDGSVILKRDSAPVSQESVDTHLKISGGTTERVETVTVISTEKIDGIELTQQQAEKLAELGLPAEAGDLLVKKGTTCPPVTVKLSINRMKDGSRRVAVWSPDGKIITGEDLVLEAQPVQGSLSTAITQLHGSNKWGLEVSQDIPQQDTLNFPLTATAGTFNGKVLGGLGLRLWDKPGLSSDYRLLVSAIWAEGAHVGWLCTYRGYSWTVSAGKLQQDLIAGLGFRF